jgi:ribose transport system permease protein
MSIDISALKMGMPDTGNPVEPLSRRLAATLVRMGVLPWLMIIAIVVFTLGSDSFLSERNAISLARQCSYLVLVAMAQFLVIITAGLDLSVGVVFSICSVVAAKIMAALLPGMGDYVWVVIALGCLGALGAGIVVGAVNGVGVALLRVPPFMMTLAMSSIGFGIALMMTGGTPVYGIPPEFSQAFGFGSLLGIPSPVIVTIAAIGLVWLCLNYLPSGRYLFAIGSNARAASLSGINVSAYTFLPYVLCSILAAISALLMTARLETGEANLGASMPLQSIAACVVGGVSLSGGKGRLRNVVLGALFITVVQNGMNLMRMDSYMQMVVIGVLLVLAIVFDNLRERFQHKV